jgi:hypothetical protein
MKFGNACRRLPSYALPNTSSIGGGPFSQIDDDDLDWTCSGFEAQPKLLL